jgi:sigma-B regulation protein RsbQ
MDVRTRHNVRLTGPADAPVMMLAHGFGCDQEMWHRVAPDLARDHRVVLFDYVGFGGSDLTAFDPDRYARLQGYADDVLAICRDLDLREVTFVGHSVSAMVGALASIAEPDRFAALVMVGPSARYLDDEGYEGGFSEADIADLLELMDNNHLGWQEPLAGMVMADTDRPELVAELEETFCRARPDIALQFARVTFLGDNRDDLPHVTVPTLVVQTRYDAIAPMSAGMFVNEAVPGSELVVLDGFGHCPHLSAPDETIGAIRAFVPA